MTGVTQVVRCVAEQGRFGLVALLAFLPPALQRVAARLACLSRAELDTFNNPLGPMPKIEFFQEYGRGGPSSLAAGRYPAAGPITASAAPARPAPRPRPVALPTLVPHGGQLSASQRAAAGSGKMMLA